jgi:hypothetical protein
LDDLDFSLEICQQYARMTHNHDLNEKRSAPNQRQPGWGRRKPVDEEGEINMKIGPRISESAGAWLGQNFSSRNAGAEYVLEAFPECYRRTMYDLKGRFSAGELSLLIDTFNSTMLSPRLAGQHLALSAHDSMILDGTDQKWSVDREGFEAKIAALSFFECAALEIWVKAFWEQHEKNNLEEYVAFLGGK